MSSAKYVEINQTQVNKTESLEATLHVRSGLESVSTHAGLWVPCLSLGFSENTDKKMYFILGSNARAQEWGKGKYEREKERKQIQRDPVELVPALATGHNPLDASKHSHKTCARIFAPRSEAFPC